MNKMLEWLEVHSLQALNTFWEGGKREEEELWTRKRWAEKGVRKRYGDKIDGVKRRKGKRQAR